MDLRVGTHDVVVYENVAVAEFLDALGVRAHGARISAEFGLRKRHSNSHVLVLPARFTRKV
jgi:hypothetical protein